MFSEAGQSLIEETARTSNMCWLCSTRDNNLLYPNIWAKNECCNPEVFTVRGNIWSWP